MPLLKGSGSAIRTLLKPAWFDHYRLNQCSVATLNRTNVSQRSAPMRYLMIPLAAVLLASQPAFAQCTTDMINSKAEELAERVNQLTERDPKRAAEINEQLREMEVKRTANELGDECEAYEQRLQHIEQAEKEADIPPAKER